MQKWLHFIRICICSVDGGKMIGIAGNTSFFSSCSKGNQNMCATDVLSVVLHSGLDIARHCNDLCTCLFLDTPV